MSESLISALPYLVAFVRRDGVITAHLGGRRLRGMPDLAQMTGQNVDAIWPGPVAQLLRQMVRKALASRSDVESGFGDGGRHYRARMSAHGRERVLCVIREVTEGDASDRRRAGNGGARARGGGMERRGFVQRMKRSIADASLREQPLSLCMIHLGGLADIGRTIDFSIADRVATAALQRLPQSPAVAGELRWYSGQLSEDLIAIVIEGATEREELRTAAEAICDALRKPIGVGDASFELAPRAGLATLGEDATKPQALFEHARAALAEARRSGSGTLQFYSDTLRLLPGIRLDLERELRNAIAAGEIQLRYIGRHDLGTGQLKAVQAYLRWRHPLRGEVQPAEFLPIAASTGMAVAVSRCALARFQSDLAALRGVVGENVRLSFGPLRHHILSGTILKDLEALLRSSALQPGMIELRIAEKTLASLEKAERVVAQFAALGASVVIDEFGRGFSSLARIAQLPLRALQIDRRFVLAAAQRPSAMRFCAAAVALARSYGLTPIASGIDCDATRQQMLEIGCEQGLGDCFAPIELAPPAPAAAHSPLAVAS